MSNEEEIGKMLNEFKEQKTELSIIKNNINQLDYKINSLLSGLSDVKTDVVNIRRDQNKLDENVVQKMKKLEHESRRSFEKTTGIAIMSLVVGLFSIWFGAVSINTQTIAPYYLGYFLLLMVAYVIAFVYWIWVNFKK
jgi:seryl-tRNA synthetase